MKKVSFKVAKTSCACSPLEEKLFWGVRLLMIDNNKNYIKNIIQKEIHIVCGPEEMWVNK